MADCRVAQPPSRALWHGVDTQYRWPSDLLSPFAPLSMPCRWRSSVVHRLPLRRTKSERIAPYTPDRLSAADQGVARVNGSTAVGAGEVTNVAQGRVR